MAYLLLLSIEDGAPNGKLIKDSDPMFSFIKTAVANTTVIDSINYQNIDTCGHAIIDSDSIESDWETIIRYYGFRKCDECGEWVTPQDRRTGASTYEDGRRLCPTCVLKQELSQQRRKKIRLRGYHSTSLDVIVINGEGESFNIENVKGIGIEIEVNSYDNIVRNGEIDSTDEFYAIANPRSRNRIFRCEEDCTVKAEIISNVFTKKALYAFDWSILTDQLKLLKNDTRIANVGLHIHLSKTWLGDTPKEQVLNFLKLQFFLKSYEEDWLKISGRKRNEMGWCNFYSLEEIDHIRNRIVSAPDSENAWAYVPYGCDHHKALISSGATIELRIGKSTNDPQRIENYLKLVLGIVENVKNVPSRKCYCIGKMTKLVPNEVMNYWRRNGCFLTTNAIENQGEDF